MEKVTDPASAGTGEVCLADDVLHGTREIADFLGLAPRNASYHIEQGRIPCFRLGKAVCARKSTLLQWVAEQERSSVRNAGR